MYAKEMEEVIKEYLNNENANYAVMIDGEWGTGKTFFLTHSLTRIVESIDVGKNKMRRYAYVSLYGVQTLNEVSKEIVFQCLGKKNKKKIENADAVLDTAVSVLTASLGVVNIDLSNMKNVLDKINISNWIICFDDLERCCLPINEILGYINKLVEHNKCKVIILANESEIGKININRQLEKKYQVILSGKTLLVEDQKDKKKSGDNVINIDKLQKETERLFGEDILYKSIREKVIGLTIRFEPQLDLVYDSLISRYSGNRIFFECLQNNKQKVLKYFIDENCSNLRTLISVISSINRVYNEMKKNKLDDTPYFEKIMDDFIKYIVRFTIYIKNGGKVKSLGLTKDIGEVRIGKYTTKAFKFLENYCLTMNFSNESLIKVVSDLREEYKEEDILIKKMKHGEAKALGELSGWFLLEDEYIYELIELLKKEVEQDKYPFRSYQKIIGQMIVLEKASFNVGRINDLIDKMNHNIEKQKETISIERRSYGFDDPELQQIYDRYIDKLEFKVSEVNRDKQINEVTQFLISDNWAKDLFVYCKENCEYFLERRGFIDIIDIEMLIKKIQSATTQDIYTIHDIFAEVYRIYNINDYYLDDKEKIIEFRKAIDEIQINGITKDIAIRELKKKLDGIIQRLE